MNGLIVKNFARPVRVAFLVDPGRAESDLDLIVSFCCHKWSGKYFPILPLIDSILTDDWFRLLEAVDPDIIYSTQPLTDKLRTKIERFVSPTKIIEIDDAARKRQTDFHLADTNLIDGLGIELLPQRIAQDRDPIYKKEFVFIKHAKPSNSSQKFILRNFGALQDTIWMKSAFRDLPVENVDLSTATASDILNSALAGIPNTIRIFPLGITRWEYDRNFHWEYDQFVHGHHIVVGDSLEDFTYYWNRSLTHPNDTNHPTIWIPSSLAESTELLDLVMDYIAKRSWSNQNATNQLVSYSLAPEKLQAIASILNKKPASGFAVKQMPVGSFPVPAFRTPKISGKNERTVQLSDQNNDGLVPISTPEFIGGRSIRGEWAIDLMIEAKGDPAIRSLQTKYVRLPKNLTTAGAFFAFARPGRIINGGSVSTIVASDTMTVRVKYPTEHTLFSSLMNSRPGSASPSLNKNWKPGKFQYIQHSDKGFYLRGIIQLFGSLHWTTNIFEDPFWRKLFLNMSGKTTETLDSTRRQVSKILNLGKSSDGDKVIFQNDQYENAIVKVAELIFAKRREVDPRPIPHRVLLALFSKFTGEWNNEHGEARFGNRPSFDTDYLNDFNNLLENKVIFQGVVQRCDFCKTEDWHSVDDIESQLTCPHCFNKFPMTANPPWSYKLNSLIASGISQYGTLAVVQALYQLHSGVRDHFAFLPCQDIFHSTQENAESFTDVDVMVMVDGRVIFAEVKSNARSFVEEDFDKMAEVARDLLPHSLLFLAQANDERDEWPGWLDAKIGALKMELSDLGVKVEKHLMKWPI